MVSPDARRAIDQTEHLFLYAIMMSVCVWVVLWAMDLCLARQLRRFDAWRHWRSLSKSHFDGIFEKAFAKYDKNGDGDISETELREAVRTVLKLGTRQQLGERQERELVKLMLKADLDDDGNISLAEFKQLMRRGVEESDYQSNQTLREQFDQAFDQDKDGYTSRLELQYVMGMLPEHAERSFAELNAIAKQMAAAPLLRCAPRRLRPRRRCWCCCSSSRSSRSGETKKMVKGMHSCFA